MHTDASRERALELTRQLERRHQALSRVFFGCVGAAEDDEVEVVVISRREQVDELVPEYAKAVFWEETPGIVWQPARVVMGDEGDLFSFGVFTHELTHRFVATCYPNAPPWLNEGLAAVFESLVVRDDEIRYGIPTYQIGRGYARLLEQHAVINIVPSAVVRKPSELIHLSPSEFYRPEAGELTRPQWEIRVGNYAGAWALTHMLLFGERSLRGRFERYLHGLVFGGAHAGISFYDHFSEIDLDSLVSDYVSAATHRYERMRIRLPEIAEPTISELPPSQAHLFWADIWLRAKPDETERIEVHLELAEADPTYRSRVSVRRAAMSGDLAEARSFLAAADQQDRDTIRARAAIVAGLGFAQRASVARDVPLELSRQLIELPDRDVTDDLLLAELLRQAGRPASAVRYALRAVRADPGSLWARLFLARALGDAGRVRQAIPQLTAAIYMASHSNQELQASLMSELRRLQSRVSE